MLPGFYIALKSDQTYNQLRWIIMERIIISVKKKISIKIGNHLESLTFKLSEWALIKKVEDINRITYYLI
jgi:hypothetical protein